MKKKTMLLSLALVLMLLCSFNLAVSAQSDPGKSSEIILLGDMSAGAESESPDVQSETSTQPVADETDAESAPETPAPQKGNTPYFIGAGIAVVMFIGVAFYCKVNSNKTL